MPAQSWDQLLALFNLTPPEMALLNASQDMVREVLPGVLDEMHRKAHSGSELTTAVAQPAIRKLRSAYWETVATGGVSGNLLEIGRMLGEAYADHGVPSKFLTMGHSTTMLAIMDALRLARRRRGLAMWERLRNSAAYREQTTYQHAFSKITWLGLSTLLEGHNQAESNRKLRVLSTIETSFKQQIGTTLNSIDGGSSELEAAVESMTIAANRSLQNSEKVASAAEQASSTVANVARGATELSTSVQQVLSQVAQSSALATQAVETAQRTDGAVKALEAYAKQIGEVVNLISNIAAQTDLLALNATIEAARAGDAGRGFAVVASEVKNLAKQTARATQDVRQQIGQLQVATTETVVAIGDIRREVDELSGVFGLINLAIDRQCATSHEIRAEVDQATRQNDEVTALTAIIRGDNGTTVSVATHLATVASGLTAKTDSLLKASASFMADARAA